MLRLLECLLLALKEEHPSSVVVKVPMEALNMVSGKTADGLAWNYLYDTEFVIWASHHGVASAF
jgi:hypothetical protein